MPANNPQRILVDRDDNIIGSAALDAHDPAWISRISALWVTNSRGEVLIARRALTKRVHPGRWAAAVAGTNELGETYYSNIVKEAEEELGLVGIEPVPGPKVAVITDKAGYFCQWFFLVVDKEIHELTFQPSEVMEARWISKQELKQQIEQNPKMFSHSMDRWIEMFCNP